MIQPTKSKIILFGASGMVGQNILEHELVNKYQFLTPCRKELDLTNADATYAYIKKNNPKIIIHVAGRVGGIQANISNPVDFLVTNVDIGRNIILASYKARVPRLINIASSCMYPRNAINPLNENLILKGELEPSNEGYALAKIFATRLCEYINFENKLNSKFKVRYKTLIPCNLYGRYDNFNNKNSHLVAAIINKIHRAKVRRSKKIDIWGDGNARREFMYAGDLAGAIFQTLNDYNKIPDLINIGTGYDCSINEYYTFVAKVIGWKGRFVYKTNKPVGMMQKLVDITRQRQWGWMPSTSLISGIKKTYKFYLQKKKA
jgi:GDP-L-fucose synthase